MAFLSVSNITKYFPGVRALDDVSVDFEKGTVHALMGENGAGKSTLGKIIAGIYTADQPFDGPTAGHRYRPSGTSILPEPKCSREFATRNNADHQWLCSEKPLT